MDNKMNRDSPNKNYYGITKLSMPPNQRLISLKMYIIERG